MYEPDIHKLNTFERLYLWGKVIFFPKVLNLEALVVGSLVISNKNQQKTLEKGACISGKFRKSSKLKISVNAKLLEENNKKQKVC